MKNKILKDKNMNIFKGYEANNKYLFLSIGLVIIVALFFPYLFLKEKAYFPIHDQLDGEIIVYMLRAKHILASEIYEFLGGVSASALTPASWATMLLFVVLGPFEAYLLNYFFVSIVAFIGMYLLTYEVLNKGWISLFVGILFTMIPFYPVYGLAVMGQPLFWYLVLNILKGKFILRNSVLIGVFPLFSSLILVGYANIILLVFIIIFKSLKDKKITKRLCIPTLVLIASYGITNINIIMELFIKPGEFVSHKTELIAEAQPILQSIKAMFIDGHYHSAPTPFIVVISVSVTIFIGIILLSRISNSNKKKVRQMVVIFALIIFICIFYGVFKSDMIVSIRNSLGGVIAAIQLDRFYWLLPFLWFLLFSYVVYFLAIESKNKIINTIKRCCLILVMVSIVLTTSLSSTSIKNYARLVKDEIPQTTTDYSWESFFSVNLFQDIQKYIGRPLNSYRVASINLHPYVSLYNGFYTIDGYSNNYSLAYKKDFREVIELELEKNAGLKTYYDNWGNRCYLFINDNDYYINKYTTFYAEDAEINTLKMLKMGAEYILSTVELNVDKNEGLVLEGTFENEIYRIYLYKIY